MQVVNGISIACLALMVGGFLAVVINLIVKNRADRITYIRDFKKGRVILIYLVAFPLFLLAHISGGKPVFDGVLSSIQNTIDLVVLKYDTSALSVLMAQSILFKATIYVCYILVGLNAIMFALSLVSQYLWGFFQGLAFKYSNKQRLYIFGNNAQSRYVYDSDDKRTKIIVDKIANNDALALYMANVRYASTSDLEGYIQKTVKTCIKRNKNCIVIINTGDDDKNTELNRYFINSIDALSVEDRQKAFESIKIFAFGDPRYQAIYEDIVGDAHGCITYLNKYQMMAVDFIDKHPFSSFMTDEHIDYQTSYIKDGVNINALMIGFGKTNQQIFLTSVANNQFIKKGKTGTELKKVNYHIFDKQPAENNKNLNHNYNRYKNECAGVDEKDYLPLPDYPAIEKFYRLDVNDMGFYNEIRNVVNGSEKDLNFIIIAFGSDLDNIDMAQKLIAKCKEWGVENVYIFVKVRGEHKGHDLHENKNCFIIAGEDQAVYDLEKILGDDLFKMAQMRNEVYDMEYEVTSNAEPLTERRVNEIRENARKNWYLKKSQLERDSSLYCCLSLRSKLNLMGLDYVAETDARAGLTEQEYLDIYAKGDMPDRDFYTVKVDGKPIVHYTLQFKDGRRKNLAVHEHLRWNSYMISKGIVPASIEQIKTEKRADGKFTNGRNYEVRRHGNLTTFDGLVEFRKMVADRDNACEESKDVIKYDYQLLDDAYWLLKKNNFKIIKKD